MPRQPATNWLDFVNDLIIGHTSHRPHLPFRRLGGERLECRTVLSGAPVDAPAGESLAEYLQHEAPMGPIAPAEVAPATDTVGDVVAPDLSALPIDQYFDFSQGEGAGEGEGSGSGSGSGGGSSSGSGNGGGSASGSSSSEPEINNTEIGTVDGTITVYGSLADDTGLEGMSLSLDGGQGTITINEDGTFTVSIDDPEGNSTFTLTARDADGNQTTYTFTYHL